MYKSDGVLTEVNEKDLLLLDENPEKFWQGVDEIGQGAFSEVDWIIKKKKLLIPKNIKTIDSYAFWGRDEIKEFILQDGLKNINECAFFNCTNLEKVIIPSSVEFISRFAFGNCSNLKEVKISSEINFINFDAFDGCNKLKVIKFKNFSLLRSNKNDWGLISNDGNILKLFFNTSRISSIIKEVSKLQNSKDNSLNDIDFFQ